MAAINSTLTATRLREVLLYNPETGDFIRREKGPRYGKPAGGGHGFGYVKMMVDGIEYLGHQLAWLYMTGEWAGSAIDHINGKRGDNRWVNLRLTDPSRNASNAGIMRTNTNGRTGTYYLKSVHRWKAQFRNRHLGMFDTQEDAHQAYAKAVRNYYGEEYVHERFRMSAEPLHKDSLLPVDLRRTPRTVAQRQAIAPLPVHPAASAVEANREMLRDMQPHPSTDKESLRDRHRSLEETESNYSQRSLAEFVKGLEREIMSRLRQNHIERSSRDS